MNAAADARLSAACAQLGVAGPPIEIIPSVVVTENLQGRRRVSALSLWRVRRWIKRRRRLVESVLRLYASPDISSAPYR